MERPNQFFTYLVAALAVCTLVCVQGCGWKQSKGSIPVESSREHQVTTYDPPESDCSMELAKVRRELSEKDTMIFDLQSRIKFLEQKNTSLEKILAQRESVQKRPPVPVNPPRPVASRPVSPRKLMSQASSWISPGNLYKNSHIFLKKKQYPEAQRGFAAFAEKYSSHSLADNALYWLGECHYTQGQYREAVQVFNTLRKRYPKGEKVPDALLKTGYSYIALKDIPRAKKYLSMLLKTYPFSLAAPKAQEKLKELE